MTMGENDAIQARCLTCDNLGYLDFGTQGDIFKRSSTKNLSNSAADGCRSCQNIVQAYSAYATENSNDGTETDLMLLSATPHESLSLYGGPDDVELYSCDVQSFQSTSVSVGSDGNQGPSLKTQLEFFQHCLTDCLQNHRKCSSTQARKFRPCRLIQMDHNRQHSRIIESSSTYVDNYVALSHCWGGSQPLKLLRAKYNEMLISIDKHLLPQTFRDTIHVCKEFSVTHLWIDSLCIIQDDKEDWEREAALMCQVYENSYFTIVAASSPNSGVSFLENMVNHESPIVLNHQPNTSGRQLKVRKIQSHGFHAFFTIEKTECDPTDARKWTLQELLLSTRAMIFSTKELQWVCRQKVMCECDGDQAIQGSVFTSRSEEDITSDPQKFWHQIVELYAARSLTYESDTFLALSGLATKVAKASDWKYLAGLWKESLLLDLCWRTDQRASSACRLSSYQAPTFSWASLKNVPVSPARIKQDARKYEELAEVLDCSVTLQSANPFGPIIAANLSIEGLVIDGFLSFDPSDDLRHKYTISIGHTDLGLMAYFYEDCHLLPNDSDNSSSTNIDYVQRSDEPSTKQWGPHRIQILVISGHEFDRPPERMLTAIVLERSVLDPVMYERLGLATIQSTLPSTELSQMFEWVHQASRSNLKII